MNNFSEKVRKVLPKSKFLSGVITISIGTLLGQGLVVLASPVLTRLYTPEDFGILAVYTSFIGIFSIMASLRYEIAIPLPENDESAANLLALSLFIIIGISFLSGAAIFFIGERVVVWAKSQVLKPYLWLLPLGIWTAATYTAFSYWAVRGRKYNQISNTKLGQGAMLVVSQCGLGLLKTGPVGLLLGQIAGYITGMMIYGISALRESINIFKKINVNGIKFVAKRYYKFPLISSISSLLDSCGQNLPYLLLASYYSPAVAGFYMVAQRIIGIPISLIGQSVAQVYFGETAQLVKDSPKKLLALYINISGKLFILGLVPILILSLFAPWLFTKVFGKDWYEAGIYLQLLSPMLLVQLVVNPLSQTLNMLERQALQFFWVIIWFVLVIGSLVTAIFFGAGAKIAVACLSAAMLCSYLVHFALCIGVIKKNIRG